MSDAPVRGRARGRFKIVVAIDEGKTSLTIDSPLTKSLTPAEIVADLRKQADTIENWFVTATRSDGT